MPVFYPEASNSLLVSHRPEMLEIIRKIMANSGCVCTQCTVSIPSHYYSVAYVMEWTERHDDKCMSVMLQSVMP